MRSYTLWRSAPFAALLVGSLLLEAKPGVAAPRAPSGSSELQTTRSAIRRLMLLAGRAESSRGGTIALARRQAETSGAKTTSAWLDWLPDFSLAVRRQVEHETDTDLSAPRWRFDFEGQIGLSLAKLRAIEVA